MFSPPKPHFQDIEISHLEPIENNLQTVLYLYETKSTPINVSYTIGFAQKLKFLGIFFSTKNFVLDHDSSWKPSFKGKIIFDNVDEMAIDSERWQKKVKDD